jgi:hypothetical protein
MTKLGFLGAAAVVLSSALASPAMAQQVIYNPGYCAQFYPNANCQNKGPGNPYTASCSATRVGQPAAHLVECRLAILLAKAGLRRMSGGQSRDEKHREADGSLLAMSLLPSPCDSLRSNVASIWRPRTGVRDGLCSCSPCRTTLVFDGAPAGLAPMGWGTTRQNFSGFD